MCAQGLIPAEPPGPERPPPFATTCSQSLPGHPRPRQSLAFEGLWLSTREVDPSSQLSSRLLVRLGAGATAGIPLKQGGHLAEYVLNVL